MKVDFIVHNITQGPARVPAIVEGIETSAVVDCVEVELTPALPRHGSLTLRFIGAERAEAANLFQEGATVALDIT